MSKKLALGEALVFAAAVAVSGDLTHFTWWAVVSLVVSDVAVLLECESARAQVLAATISTCVSVTVLFLSYFECAVFGDALESLGPAAYTVGNFALHYWPSLRLVPRAIGTPVAYIYGDAACLITLYTSIQQPANVYRCSKGPPQAAFVATSIAGTVFIEAILSFI